MKLVLILCLSAAYVCSAAPRNPSSPSNRIKAAPHDSVTVLPHDAKLLDSQAILHFTPQSDNDDPDLEIDELMPFGGDDEIEDKQKVETRADYGKTLEELIFPSTFKECNELKDMKERQKAVPIPDKRWPFNTVPYELDDIIKANPQYRGKVYNAMEEWMEKTCLKFEPYSAQLARQLGHKQRIRLITDGDGCWSYVGMQEYWEELGPQTVSLSLDGCMHHRTILHELGHALGFHHEQTRQDRDQFIDVYEENVYADYLHNFDIEKDSLVVSMPYDYLSIMHYGKHTAAKWVNGSLSTTIQTKLKCYEDLIGKARHLSYYDHKIMNSIYGCTKECNSTLCGKNCYSTKNGKNDKCHCVCLDNSNNPCRGGSCFGGDRMENCADLVSKEPSRTCYLLSVDCCESCKGVEIDTECPLGDQFIIGKNCTDRVSKEPSRTCSLYPKKCCESCKGVEIDAMCPLGDESQEWCVDEISKNPSRTCFLHSKYCCESCKGVEIDTECPLGDESPEWCAERISKEPSKTCSLYSKECCKSCKGVEIDAECPLGDKIGNCAELISKAPSRTCSIMPKQCCKSCKGVEIDTECPLGDTRAWCTEKVSKEPSRTCYLYSKECCKSCKGVEIDSECPMGDIWSGCAEGVSKEPSRTCSLRPIDCCKSCEGVEIDTECPLGDEQGWSDWCAAELKETPLICRTYPKKCCKTCKGVEIDTDWRLL